MRVFNQFRYADYYPFSYPLKYFLLVVLQFKMRYKSTIKENIEKAVEQYESDLETFRRGLTRSNPEKLGERAPRLMCLGDVRFDGVKFKVSFNINCIAKPMTNL